MPEVLSEPVTMSTGTNMTNGAGINEHINGARPHSDHVSPTKFQYAKHYLGKSRPIRIIMVGAGISGIAATKLYKDMLAGNDVQFTIYEKNADVTGTWLENRYPGFVVLLGIRRFVQA